MINTNLVKSKFLRGDFMKKKVMISLFTLSVLGIIGFSSTDYSVRKIEQKTEAATGNLSQVLGDKGHATRIYNYESLEDLVRATPTVVTAKVVSDNNPFKYDEIPMVETDVRIKDILRDEIGTLKKGEIIKVMQTWIEEDPELIKNEDVLLFLNKYEGKAVSGVYIIRGMDQGHFKIKDGNIITKAKEQKLKKNTEGKEINDVIKVIQKTNYDANVLKKHFNQRSKESIEKFEKIKKELREKGYKIRTDE